MLFFKIRKIEIRHKINEVDMSEYFTQFTSNEGPITVNIIAIGSKSSEREFFSFFFIFKSLIRVGRYF
jgi:hypothetical protein